MEYDEESIAQESLQSVSKSARQRFVNNISNHLKLGIIGMPNVGKSSLFNALANTSVSTADNSLFSTIDPCIATFCIADDKIDFIAQAFENPKISRRYASVIDTCGIVENSFHGEGLGLSSLHSLEDADVIIHVLRCFGDDQITHFYETVDPIRDLRIIHNEILMHDLRKVEEVLIGIDDIIFKGDGGRYLLFKYETLIKLWNALAGIPRPDPVRDRRKRVIERFFPEKCDGKSVSACDWDNNELEYVSSLKLLTSKEFIYGLNTSSSDYLRRRTRLFEHVTSELSLESSRYGLDPRCFLFSCEFEDRLRDIINREEYDEHILANPTHTSVVNTVIKEAYKALSVVSFYTCKHGKGETRCWSLRFGKSLSEAAGLVDTNVHRQLIRGDVISYEDFVKFEGDLVKIVLEMKVRNPGKKYIVNDGDIIEFFHSSKLF